MKIIVLYNLPTPQKITSPYLVTEQDTILSAEKVNACLKTKGAQVAMFPLTPKDIDKILQLKADLIFNLVEWTGVDYPLLVKTVKALEKTSLPFTGANLTNIQITGDKLKMKQAFAKHHLATGGWQVFRTGREKIKAETNYPVLVKLAYEHCSIGLTEKSLINNKVQLQREIAAKIADFRQPVYAEEFLSGREFQVTLLETEKGLKVMPAAEIVYANKNYQFLSFTGRWDDKHRDFHQTKVVVPKLSGKLQHEINDLCVNTYQRLKFRDYARMDLRCRKDDAEVCLLEANSNPGLDDSTDYSLSLSYQAAGYAFADFIWQIVLSALRRARKF